MNPSREQGGPHARITYYPYSELERYLKIRYPEHAEVWFNPFSANRPRGYSDEYMDVAEFLGVTTNAIYFWRRRGLGTYTADRIATRLGVHPIHIWGWDWVTNAALETEPLSPELRQAKRKADQARRYQEKYHPKTDDPVILAEVEARRLARNAAMKSRLSAPVSDE